MTLVTTINIKKEGDVIDQIYRIYHINKKGKFVKKHEFTDKKRADKKWIQYENNPNYKFAIIPKDIKLGDKVYKQGELYGEIVREDDTFFYIKRVGKGEDDEQFYQKALIEEKFIKGIFDCIEDDI